MKIVAITAITLPELTDADRARIVEAGGPGTELVVVERVRDAAEHVADADVMLGVCPARLLEAAPRLRWVHATASGVDMYMYPEFVDSDVVLTGEKGLVGGHLADHAFGLLLALTRQIATAIRLGADSWSQREAMRVVEVELEGLTMGIIGLGGTGRAMAARAAGFGMRCIAVDRDPVPPTAEVPQVDTMDALGTLLAASDVVAVCCPLTDETHHLLDDAAFAAMRPGAFIVNVTRGEIIDGDALVRALEAGQICGAGLDVAPEEPLPAGHRLWSLPNVVMTPHTAGASQYRAGRNLDRFIANLERYSSGQPLEGLIDKRLGY